MAALDFPHLGLSIGQTYPNPAVSGQPVYTWDGEKWTSGTGFGNIYISDSAPAAPAGSLWWESDTGILYVRYYDGSSTQWAAIAGSSTTGSVRYDSAQGLTSAQQTQGRQNVYAAPFDAMGWSGMQVNGSMDVSQENGTTLISIPNSNRYVVDGFAIAMLGTGAIASVGQGPISSLPGYPNCLTFQCTAANALAGASDGSYIYQPIEGYRWARLGFGTANAQPVTIGFWVFPNIAGTMAVSLRGGGGTSRSYVVDVPVTAASWQFKTVTIPGDVAGTWVNNNGIGVIISYCFGAGSGRKAALANTWVATDSVATAATTNFFATTGAIYFTGVIVLPGVEAPSAARSPFIMRPYDQELTTCMRYLNILNPGITNWPICNGFAYNTTLFLGLYHYQVPMRATPTFAINAGANFRIQIAGNIFQTTGGIIVTNPNPRGLRLDATIGTASLTIGQGCSLCTDNASGVMSFDSRL